MLKYEVYKDALKYIKSGIIIIIDENEVVFCNDMAFQILEINCIGEIPTEILKIFSFQQEVSRYEINLKKKIIGISTNLLNTEEERVKIGIFNDITKIKEKEEIDRRNEKFKLLGELAVSIAHEVRNPLNLIKGFTQLALESKDMEFIKKNIKIILSEADRLNNLATQLLDYTKSSVLNPEKLEIQGLMSDLLESLGLNGIINFQSNEEKLVIIGDKNRLIQVFLNIIKNGIEAIEDTENGFMQIELKGSELTIEINFINNGEVSEKLDIKKMFNPFYTTKTEGTGLGLAITKKIIEDHNGKINVTKNKYGGLSFVIELNRVICV